MRAPMSFSTILTNLLLCPKLMSKTAENMVNLVDHFQGKMSETIVRNTNRGKEQPRMNDLIQTITKDKLLWSRFQAELKTNNVTTKAATTQFLFVFLAENRCFVEKRYAFLKQEEAALNATEEASKAESQSSMSSSLTDCIDNIKNSMKSRKSVSNFFNMVLQNCESEVNLERYSSVELRRKSRIGAEELIREDFDTVSVGSVKKIQRSSSDVDMYKKPKSNPEEKIRKGSASRRKTKRMHKSSSTASKGPAKRINKSSSDVDIYQKSTLFVEDNIREDLEPAYDDFVTSFHKTSSNIGSFKKSKFISEIQDENSSDDFGWYCF